MEVPFSGCPKSPNDHGDENNNVDVYFDAMTIRPHDNWSNWQGCPGYYKDFAGSGLVSHNYHAYHMVTI